MCRNAIDERGMSTLVAASGSDAADNISEEARGGDAPFDPLMSMNWHFSGEAIRNGGLYLMGQDENGKQYCPICEFVKNMKGFNARRAIDDVADEMRAYCVEAGLISLSA